LEKTVMNRGSAVRRIRNALLVAASAVTLCACALSPEPLTLDEQIAQASSDRSAMFAGQELVNAPITLEQAMARAVKYNLRHRLSLMERALENRLVDASAYDLLPKLVASAGYNTRDNVNGAASRSVTTGLISLEPSTSQDRNLDSANLQLSWNILDFGLSYYAAKDQANKYLAVEERRRSAILDIMQQVRTAYWSAVTAEKLRPEVERVLADAKQALAQSYAANEQQLAPPLQTLTYQRDLVQIVQQLEALQYNLAISKSQLAELMALPPGSDYSIAIPEDSAFTVPQLHYKLDDLETVAMVKRPEINEEAYLARNVAIETRMALIKLLPGATLFGGINTDSNSYLVNQNWANAGAQVSWNLLSLVRWPQTQQTEEARAAVADVRRQALRMTVLTQVNVAYHRYEQAATQYDRFALLQKIETGIANQVHKGQQSNTQTALESIRANASAVLATWARDRSYAELQNAHGAIYQAAGMDPLHGRIADGGVDAVAAQIGQAERDIEQGKIEIPKVTAQNERLMQEQRMQRAEIRPVVAAAERPWYVRVFQQ
jgi:outer membrane protein TolC